MRYHHTNPYIQDTRLQATCTATTGYNRIGRVKCLVEVPINVKCLRRSAREEFHTSKYIFFALPINHNLIGRAKHWVTFGGDAIKATGAPQPPLYSPVFR